MGSIIRLILSSLYSGNVDKNGDNHLEPLRNFTSNHIMSYFIVSFSHKSYFEALTKRTVRLTHKQCLTR